MIGSALFFLHKIWLGLYGYATYILPLLNTSHSAYFPSFSIMYINIITFNQRKSFYIVEIISLILTENA